jgi:hypothetical protein
MTYPAQNSVTEVHHGCFQFLQENVMTVSYSGTDKNHIKPEAGHPVSPAETQVKYLLHKKQGVSITMP